MKTMPVHKSIKALEEHYQAYRRYTRKSDLINMQIELNRIQSEITQSLFNRINAKGK